MNPKTTDFHLQDWRFYKNYYGPLPVRWQIALLNLPPLVGLVSWIFFRKVFFTNHGGEQVFLICTAFWCLVMFCVLVFLINKNWKRNVVGYNLWVERLRDPEPVHREIIGWVVPRGQVSTSHISPCAIVIPLGGWFNKEPRIFYRAWHGFGIPKVCWQLTDFHPIYSDSIADSTIKIQTPHGEAVAVSVSFALDFFDQWMDEEKKPPVMPLGMVFSESIRTNIGNTAKIEKLFDILTSTAQAIADTKRFGKSKEVARIREQLISDLLELLPEGDQRRKVIEPAKPAA